METISFSDARNRLKQVLDRVAEDAAHLARSIAEYRSGLDCPHAQF